MPLGDVVRPGASQFKASKRTIHMQAHDDNFIFVLL